MVRVLREADQNSLAAAAKTHGVIDHTWLIAAGTVRASGTSRTSFFFSLIRRFSSSSR